MKAGGDKRASTPSSKTAMHGMNPRVVMMSYLSVERVTCFYDMFVMESLDAVQLE
ncbi:17020_t:CDS:2 [Funneliformis caledonium]|uniref:17020_t:CDS:1 n=1 Tax=Funneliformis caledonium TaxID=1117310 RepID=A0A9N8VAV3_9GLOM|nr:17020_t:CDS:2 [Funneliformis caledonium]